MSCTAPASVFSFPHTEKCTATFTVPEQTPDRKSFACQISGRLITYRESDQRIMTEFRLRPEISNSVAIIAGP